MFMRGCRNWASLAILLAVVCLAAPFAAAQQPLPDAPRPQNNAPAPTPTPEPTPDVTAPVPGMGDNSGAATPDTNPPTLGNTRQTSDPPQNTNPQAPPPGSQDIKTVPSSKASSAPGNDFDELFKLEVNVNFISVPVTVKDPEGQLVDGLLAQDFSIYEDNSKQTITFFTSDPFPLSAALVIDLGISETTLKKVASTYSALDGSFGPFDKVAVFTYGNTVKKQADFGNTQRLQLSLQRIRDLQGQNPGSPVVGGPLGSPDPPPTASPSIPERFR